MSAPKNSHSNTRSSASGSLRTGSADVSSALGKRPYVLKSANSHWSADLRVRSTPQAHAAPHRPRRHRSLASSVVVLPQVLHAPPPAWKQPAAGSEARAPGAFSSARPMGYSHLWGPTPEPVTNRRSQPRPPHRKPQLRTGSADILSALGKRPRHSAPPSAPMV